MIRLFLKLGWRYLPFVLLLISFDLYAQCFNYTGLKQRVGYGISRTSYDVDITTTFSGFNPTRINREINEVGSSIGYYLQYCSPSNLFLYLDVIPIISETSDLADSNGFSSSTDSDRVVLGIYVGYEW